MTPREIEARINLLKATPSASAEVSAFIEGVLDSDPMALYGYGANHARLQPLTESTLNRILAHGSDGMIILSADRAERTVVENYIKRGELIEDLKSRNLSYTVVYGGYRDLKKGETANGETSFVVPAHYRGGQPVPWDKMVEFAKEMCGKYDQESVLVQAPGETPKYIDRNGDVMMEFDGPTRPNDLKQEYFTSLVKSRHFDDGGSGRKPKEPGSPARTEPGALKRFSFTDAPKGDAVVESAGLLVNPPPCSYSEMHLRGESGEIFALWDEIPAERRR